MRRRDFIKLSAGFGAAATLAPMSPARAQAKSAFKASDVQPPGYPTVAATENLGKKLEAATQGRLSVQMYPSMQMGGEKETIEQTRTGALQIGVIDGAENNPPSYVFSNHYTTAKYYSLTEHLIIPEVLLFSKKAWTQLSADDQNLIKKFAREAQLEERELWTKYEQQAMDKAQAAGCEIVEIADKAPFQNAVKPVWDKYGPKYQDIIKRIQAI